MRRDIHGNGDKSKAVNTVENSPTNIGTAVVQEIDEERVDVLAQLEPRQLPPIKFSTDEFLIGDRPYGSWQFTLDPNSSGAAFSDIILDFRRLRLNLDDLEAEAENDEAISSYFCYFNWHYYGVDHCSELAGSLYGNNMADILAANGYAHRLESDKAIFLTDISWPGSPAIFAAENLSGNILFEVEDGRFLQGAGAAGALKLISILNFDPIMMRLRFSDDLLRSGLTYDEITGQLSLDDDLVKIDDRLVISGPSNLYQITGELDLAEETIFG